MKHDEVTVEHKIVQAVNCGNQFEAGFVCL